MDFHHLISGLSAIEELKYRIYHAGDSKLGDTLLKIGYTIDPGAIVLKKILNKYLMLGEGKSAEEANQESFLLYRGTLEGIATATVDLGAGLIQAPANILNLLGAILADGGSGKLGTQMVNDLHASLLQTVETLKTGSARDKGHVIGTTLLNLVTIVLGGAGASKKLKGVSKLDDLENVDDLGKLGNLDNVDDLGKLKNIDNMEGSALVDDVGKGGKGASRAKKTLSSTEAEEYAFNAIKGSNKADDVVLGKFKEGSSTSYDAIAKEMNAQYFNLDNWDELSTIYSSDEIWKINEKFLDIQTSSGREIYLSHNPGKFLNDHSYYSKEIQYLIDNGYKFFKEGDIWHAIR